MFEGIIISGILLLALIALYFFNRPKVVTDPMDNLPPVTLKVPMPEVKPTRQPAASTLYSVPYGQTAREEREAAARIARVREEEAREERRRERNRRLREAEEEADRRHQESYVDTDSVLLGAVAAVAAVVVAESIYESFVDTTPAYEYSSPTPSSYSEPSSSSWGDSSSSSSDSGGSSWSD